MSERVYTLPTLTREGCITGFSVRHKGEELARIPVERGHECFRCGHVTKEPGGPAGCCRETVIGCDVIVCPNCDTLHAASRALPHLNWCFAGKVSDGTAEVR